jgi:hypothetical protein
MRISIVIFSLIIQSQASICQVFDLNSNWTEIRYKISDGSVQSINNYRVDGDTIIGNVQYARIIRNGNFELAIRESVDFKVFVYYPETELEYLLYDFDWIEGKTLYFQEPQLNEVNTYFTINTIDSIELLDGKYYKCLKVDDEIFCIRGIGSIDGFFSFFFEQPLDGTRTAILCFYKGEQLIYSNPDYNNCTVHTELIKNCNNDNFIKIYPQPSNGTITIELLSNASEDAIEILIFDERGIIVDSFELFERNSIKIQNLPVGTYFYQIYTPLNQKYSGKIIITN